MYRVTFENDNTHFFDWAYAEDIHGISLLSESYAALGCNVKRVRLKTPESDATRLWCCVQERPRDGARVSTFHKTFSEAIDHASRTEKGHTLISMFEVSTADQG